MLHDYLKNNDFSIKLGYSKYDYRNKDTDNNRNRQFSVKALELVVDVPCVHAPCIEEYHFFLYFGDILLMFGDQQTQTILHYGSRCSLGK